MAPRPRANFSAIFAMRPASVDGSTCSRRAIARPRRAGSPASTNSTARAPTDITAALAPAHFTTENAVGFADARNHAQPIGDCPAQLFIEDIAPDPMDELALPQDLYFTVGDSLAHARLTFVRECSVGASLECHSG